VAAVIVAGLGLTPAAVIARLGLPAAAVVVPRRGRRRRCRALRGREVAVPTRNRPNIAEACGAQK
jgi:hypothetical protein